MRQLVVGTAGHIDHGKTALVRALTGIDTDRLPEEKRRGITIELGFAPWPLGPELCASIIDVPGHERLVRTMVAGAIGMDVAMLLVAADDGVMPQTREHFDVLTLLGVPAGLVVLTKCDLVDSELLSLVDEEVDALVANSVFAQAPVIRVSSKTGQGLAELPAAVARLARGVPPPPRQGPAFLPVDRVFHKAGHGTVATGTLLRGTLHVSDGLDALGDGPTPIGALKARGLQVQGTAQTHAEAGMRVAINVAGKGTEGLTRGMVLTTAGGFGSTATAIAHLALLAHAPPLSTTTITVHAGTTERLAKLIPLGTDALAPGAQGSVFLRFAAPLPLFAGQRLIIRGQGPHGATTLAGGIVLDPQPPSGKGALSAARAARPALEQDDPALRLLQMAQQARAAGLDRAALLRRLPTTAPADLPETLVRQGHLVHIGGAKERWVAVAVLRELAQKVTARVAAAQARAALSLGTTEAELSSQLAPPEQPLAILAVERACADNLLERDGIYVRLAGSSPAGDVKTQRDLQLLHELFIEAGVPAPFDAELPGRSGLSSARIAQLLPLLRQDTRLIRVAPDLHLAATALQAVEATLVQALRERGELTAAAFKELAGGVSRKWAIPLLEYFDRKRVTMRVGDVRRLGPASR